MARELLNTLFVMSPRAFLRLDGDTVKVEVGGEKKLQEDPHWRDYIQFYEYFHGDNGAGLGANHQTGWTGVIARAMHLFATTTADQVLELGKMAAVVETEPPVQSRPTAGAARNRKAKV